MRVFFTVYSFDYVRLKNLQKGLSKVNLGFKRRCINEVKNVSSSDVG